MTIPLFPALNGQAWPVHKKPTFSTRRVQSVSGRIVRAPLYWQAIWAFEMQFDALSDSATANAMGAQSLQQLMGFYAAVQQTAGTFRYSDPTDFQATAQSLGTGDGTNETFTFLHTFAGYFTEPVGQVEASGLEVFVNGSLASPSTYTVTLPNTLTFHTAPSSGAAITGSYTYYFVCEFTDDTLDFQNDMEGLWSLGSLKFQSVKP